MRELKKKPIESKLWNQDLSPIDIDKRNWHKWNVAALWVGMAVNIPTYMLGSGLIGSGMNWWQAILTIILGNLIVLVPMMLVGHAGTKYGIPFPVFLRSCFGTEGARVASLLRAFVACGWFGILTWIGGNSIYQLLLIVFPVFAQSYYFSGFIGLNVEQLSCFLAFWFLQMVILRYGMRAVKHLTVFAAPLLLGFGIALLIWAWVKVGSFHKILGASYTLSQGKHAQIWSIFWPGLTSVIGFWSTLALNILDFTRFARSQKDQALGHLIGLPPAMAFYSFLGIVVTSATVLIFGKAIWDPVILLSQFKVPFLIFIGLFAIGLATMCCNVTANVVSAANDFSNFWPKQISFTTGCMITGVVGILICPWKLIADPQGYIFRWLLAYSSLLGAVGGIMLCDYYLLRKTHIDLHDLFQHEGKYTFYRGWNRNAFLAFGVAIIPCVPGFLVKVGAVSEKFFPNYLVILYDYAWFVALASAFLTYYALMRRALKREQLL
ncbi:MAG: NCS1 family nucleobase:cation symporter-1 [Gammaproteobacteria bacterium]